MFQDVAAACLFIFFQLVAQGLHRGKLLFSAQALQQFYLQALSVQVAVKVEDVDLYAALHPIVQRWACANVQHAVSQARLRYVGAVLGNQLLGIDLQVGGRVAYFPSVLKP